MAPRMKDGPVRANDPQTGSRRGKNNYEDSPEKRAGGAAGTQSRDYFRAADAAVMYRPSH